MRKCLGASGQEVPAPPMHTRPRDSVRGILESPNRTSTCGMSPADLSPTTWLASCPEQRTASPWLLPTAEKLPEMRAGAALGRVRKKSRRSSRASCLPSARSGGGYDMKAHMAFLSTRAICTKRFLLFSRPPLLAQAPKKLLGDPEDRKGEEEEERGRSRSLAKRVLVAAAVPSACGW